MLFETKGSKEKCRNDLWLINSSSALSGPFHFSMKYQKFYDSLWLNMSILKRKRSKYWTGLLYYSVETRAYRNCFFLFLTCSLLDFFFCTFTSNLRCFFLSIIYLN